MRSINALLIALSLFFVFPQQASAKRIYGVLMVVKGKVYVESQKSGKTKKARVGSKVFPGDTIETKKDSRAKLVMIDKNIINISPDTKFTLEKYTYNRKKKQKNAVIDVIYGKVRSTVKQKYDGKQSKYQVKTPSAVAGVRGTDFVVSYNQITQVSKVVTFEGLVEVGKTLNKIGQIQDPVKVEPGQFTVAGQNSAPALPVPASRGELQTLNRDTDADKAPDPMAEDRLPSNDNGEENSDDQGDNQNDRGDNRNDKSPDMRDPSSEDGTGGEGANLEGTAPDGEGDTTAGSEPPPPTGSVMEPKIDEDFQSGADDPIADGTSGGDLDFTDGSGEKLPPPPETIDEPEFADTDDGDKVEDSNDPILDLPEDPCGASGCDALTEPIDDPFTPDPTHTNNTTRLIINVN